MRGKLVEAEIEDSTVFFFKSPVFNFLKSPVFNRIEFCIYLCVNISIYILQKYTPFVPPNFLHLVGHGGQEKCIKYCERVRKWVKW